jgi:nitrous oxidase accessory protein
MIRFLLFTFFAISANAGIIHVGKGHLPSIKSAIETARSGDTIVIHPGIYKEGNIIIKKSLTILGVNYPLLDGESKYEIMTIVADHVTISGLHLANTGIASIEDIAAIKGVEAHDLKVINNRLTNTYFGIHLSNSGNSLIEGNTLTSDAEAEHQIGNGIHLWKCEHAMIRKNKIMGHRDGIYFEFVTHSKVVENLSYGNLRYGLHFMFSHEDEYVDNIFRNNGSGVAVMYTMGVTMTGNRFEENWGSSSYGLLLKDIRDSKIERNIFYKNTIGVLMEGCTRSYFKGNEFSQNGWALKIQANCDANTFIENNFISNTFDISTNGSISLNTISKNYWDKYEGYDLNKDGIGDIPFRPVSLYGMVVEKMPTAVMLWRSFLVTLLDKAEKVMPVVTPENLKDESPSMKFIAKRF